MSPTRLHAFFPVALIIFASGCESLGLLPGDEVSRDEFDEVQLEIAAGGILPVADARVEKNRPTRNYGTASRLYSDTSPVEQSYLRFEVKGLSEAVESCPRTCSSPGRSRC